MRRILLPLALVVLAAAPAAAQVGDSVLAVRPGDVMRLNVWRMPEFSGDFPLGNDGRVLHPLLTTVQVVGRTPEQVRAQLREVLLRYERDPQFVFGFLYRVGLSGAFRLPNLYTLPPETTLLQATAAGGGAEVDARLDRVELLRDGQVLIVDLENPSPEVAAMRIRSGDLLRVSQRRSGFRDAVSLTASLTAALAAIFAAVSAASN